MARELLKLLVKREKNYNIKKWRLLAFSVIILSFVFTSIISLELNDINNVNNMFPYQLLISDTNKNVYNQMYKKRNELSIKEVGLYTDLGVSLDNGYRIIYADPVGMNANKLEIFEGTLPQLSDEVAIYGDASVQIGDVIDLTYFDSFDNRRINEKFTVSARLNSDMYEKKNEIGILVSEKHSECIVGNQDRNVVYINFTTNKKHEIIQNSEIIGEKYGVNNRQIYVNHDYIDGIFGDVNQLIIIIVLGFTCSLIVRSIIYTIFNIYFDERIEYLRRLKLAGMIKSDFYDMNNYETRKIFLNTIWGYLLAIILLLVYMRFQISLGLTFSCLVFVSIVIYAAIHSATKRQMKELLGKDNLSKSIFEYITADFVKIQKIRANKITIMDLSKRNNKICRRRNGMIIRSIVLTCIMFIIISTLFNSIDYDKQISHSFIYGEEYIIYPDLQNFKQQLKNFQKMDILNKNLIDEIRNIKGVKEVIESKRVYVNIRDEHGHKYEGSVQLNHDMLEKRLAQCLEAGQISDGVVIVNRRRMKQMGLTVGVGDKLYVKETDSHDFSSFIIGGIINDQNSGNLLYLPDDFETGYNLNYSVSIFIEGKKNVDSIVAMLKKIMQNYPQLRVRCYFTELMDIKSAFKDMMMLLQVIIGLFFLISIVNTINIINMDLLSRDKEFALLEVNGMSRRILKMQLFIEYGSMLSVMIGAILVLSYLLSLIIDKMAATFFRIGYLSYAYSYGSFGLVCLIIVIVVFAVVAQRVNRLDMNLSIRLK